MKASRLPSFGELPIKSRTDFYIPGEYTPLPKFALTTEKESEQSTKIGTTWDRDWVMPKPVSKVGGNQLVTYKRDAFRKLGKEGIFKKLAIIPSPTLEPELQGFNGLPTGLGTLGQTSEAQTETGTWGNLISALTVGATKYLELEKGVPVVKTTVTPTPTQASLFSSSSSLMPILIIGGIAFLVFRGKGVSKFIKGVRKRSR